MSNRRHARLARAAALSAAIATGTAAIAAGSGSAGAVSQSNHGNRAAIVARAKTAAHQHAGKTHLGAHQSLSAVQTQIDRNGETHVRLHRSYRGLTVVGGDMVIHQAAGGAWRGASGTLHKGLTMSTKPKLSKKQARKRALAPRAGDKGVTQKKVSKPKLIIDADHAQPRLAWRVTSAGRQSDGTPSRLVTDVDANTGAILDTQQTIETVEGNGDGLYTGNVPIGLTQSGSSYLMADPNHGGDYVTDAKNGTDSVLCTLLGLMCIKGTEFSGSTTSFGDGKTDNRATVAVDAEYGAAETWDFYQKTFGRNGIFGDGQGTYSRVHYGNKYDNAFWDGSKMSYGDGDGTQFGPLVSLDVTGHEMSHGVTQATAGLNYSGESGGLNEATSDIMGTMVEFFANNPDEPGNYYIGEKFDHAGSTGIRRMDNPASDGTSLNCWSSSAGSVDVHYSSGIANHFFYLLAEGSGAKTVNGFSYNSPTCDGSSVTGIGRDAAAAIWYRALTTYFTSNTNYAAARTATLQAASDLYGANSTQYNAVAAAWSAVNVS